MRLQVSADIVLTSDACAGTINCLSVFGMSAVVSFVQNYWVTKDYKKAAKSAIFIAIQVYGMAFAGETIESQLFRTGLVTALNLLATEINKSISVQMAQESINAFRVLAGTKSFAKFLGSAVINQRVTFIVFSVRSAFTVSRLITVHHLLPGTNGYQPVTSGLFCCYGWAFPP